MRKTILLITILVCALSVNASFAFYEITQLTDNSRHDYDVQISDNGSVVWVGGVTSVNEIFLYDGSSTTQLSNTNTINTYAPQINASGTVVWSSRYGGLDGEIFIYDGSSTTQLTDDDVNDHSPQINDNGSIVWGGEGGVFLYDGSSTTMLANSGGAAQINRHDSAVWADGYDIFLYDGSSTTQLTNGHFFETNHEPQISDNGFVVWSTGYGWGGERMEIISSCMKALQPLSLIMIIFTLIILKLPQMALLFGKVMDRYSFMTALQPLSLLTFLAT